MAVEPPKVTFLANINPDLLINEVNRRLARGDKLVGAIVPFEIDGANPKKDPPIRMFGATIMKNAP